MNNEKLIKLNRSEVFRVEVCLSARKTFLETLREEENSELELVNDLIRDNNNDIDEELEEINEILDKVNNSDKSICEDLSELSKEELILKIKQLEGKNEELKEQNEDLKDDLETYKASDNATTLEVASYFTNYENIQRRYDLNNVPYQMQTVEDVAKVFGLRFDSIQGFYDLSQEDKEIFKNGIVKFLNAFGLGNRVPYLPTKVWKEQGEFRFLTLEGGARQQFMKSTGEVY